MVGRNYTAQTLNLANNSNLTQYDVSSEPSFLISEYQDVVLAPAFLSPGKT